MDFGKVNEFDKHRRELLNKLNSCQKKKSELMIQQKEVTEDYVHSNMNVEYKQELDTVKKELKTMTSDICNLRNDI